jgi:hypothetical protein
MSEEVLERKWRLVYESGLAPKCLGYEYVSRGRHYLLSLCVYYDERGQPHPFGSLRLTVNNLKTYEFKTYKQIKRYLQRKKVPLTGIEELVSLWG